MLLIKKITKKVIIPLFILAGLGLVLSCTSEEIPNIFELVSAGGDHSLAITISGDLFSWGDNETGQLGDGTRYNRPVPVQIGKDHKWKTASAGDEFSLAVTTTGELYAWGINHSGQLGDGTTSTRSNPVRIGEDMEWEEVAAGAVHSVGMTTDGKLYAWGVNSRGQLGDGTSSDRRVPTLVKGDHNWKMFSVGSSHNVAISSNDKLFVWGSGENGRLGNGGLTNVHVPTQVGNRDWSYVSAGFSHSLAVTKLGEIFSWGENIYGQLGNQTCGHRTFVHYLERVYSYSEILEDFKFQLINWDKVAAGVRHNIAITREGELYAWGNKNCQSEEEDAYDPAGYETYPTKLDTGTLHWKSVSVGNSHSLGISMNGDLYTWGNDTYGQLGNGVQPEDVYVPTRVDYLYR